MCGIVGYVGGKPALDVAQPGQVVGPAAAVVAGTLDELEPAADQGQETVELGRVQVDRRPAKGHPHDVTRLPIWRQLAKRGRLVPLRLEAPTIVGRSLPTLQQDRARSQYDRYGTDGTVVPDRRRER